MRVVRVASFTAVALLSLVGTASAACLNPSDCAEWIGSGSSRVLVYRSHALTTQNQNINHAVVVIHGAGRDGDNYFRHMGPGMLRRFPTNRQHPSRHSATRGIVRGTTTGPISPW